MIARMNPIKRKVNYAFCVNFITPYSNFAKQVLLAVKLDKKSFCYNYLWHFHLTTPWLPA